MPYQFLSIKERFAEIGNSLQMTVVAELQSAESVLSVIDDNGFPDFQAFKNELHFEEWEESVGRVGRWIDFRHDYKTMYPWFMESVWWAFSELFKKGLVYRGVKVCCRV